MAKAIFVVPCTSNGPTLNMEELYEYIDGKVRDGCGYTVIGNIPNVTTCLVIIDSGIDNINALKTNPDYLWIEDIDDGEII